VISDVPLPTGGSVKAFNHPLGHSEVSIFAACARRSPAPRLPGSLDGAPFLLPTGASALRRELERWFDRHELRPRVVGEFDDSALLKVFGQAGVGAFAAPSVISREISRQYRVKPSARRGAPSSAYFAISVERRSSTPASSRSPPRPAASCSPNICDTSAASVHMSRSIGGSSMHWWVPGSQTKFETRRPRRPATRENGEGAL
jgi:hypothetical protein